MNPQAMKMMITMIFSTVKMFWNEPLNFKSRVWIKVIKVSTPKAIHLGFNTGKMRQTYDDKAMQVSATGAAKPTINEIQPDKKPTEGW